MEIKTIIILAIVLTLVMPIIIILVEKQDQRDKAKTNFGASLYLKKSRKNSVYSIYKFLCDFSLTRGYIQKISRRYEIICPMNPNSIANKTMSLVGLSFLFSTLEISMIYLIGPSMNNFVLAIYLIFVINNEIINCYIRTAEIKLLEEIERFITNVGDSYFNKYHIDDAILDAVNSRMSEEMKIHAKILYEISTADNLKEAVVRYNNTIHNKYLKTFLSLCINVIENGDKRLHGQQLLTLNLLSLKREINLEYLKQTKLRFVFSGSIFVAVAVCVPITWIQNFAVSIAPELEQIYHGQIGILYVGVIFLTSAIVYIMINDAKEVKKVSISNNTSLKKLESITVIKEVLNNFCDKFYGITLVIRDTLKRLGETITPKQLLLKSLIIAISTFFFGIGAMFYIHQNNRILLTDKVVNIENMTSASSSEISAILEETILSYVNRYKGDKDFVTQESICSQVEKEGIIYNEALIMEAAEEIVSRIENYKQEYFKWYELLICLGMSMITFFIPYLMILYRRKLLQENMQDEVVQFNSIIYMMMYSDYISVIDILEQMELFAVVYKSTIRECINEYNSGDIQALIKMKERETNEEFLKLVDSLIRCDDIPIAEAFNKIACDRENNYDRRKQENEISIQKKADNIKPLSWIPGILIIIYLILPLLYAGLKELLNLRALIQNMSAI